MSVMLINEDIIWNSLAYALNELKYEQDKMRPLFWFSFCPKLFGAKEKLCI